MSDALAAAKRAIGASDGDSASLRVAALALVAIAESLQQQNPRSSAARCGHQRWVVWHDPGVRYPAGWYHTDATICDTHDGEPPS